LFCRIASKQTNKIGIKRIESIPYARVSEPTTQNPQLREKRNTGERDMSAKLAQLRHCDSCDGGSIAQQNCGAARKESAKRQQRLCDRVSQSATGRESRRDTCGLAG
jgi:hypothetical protein